MYALYITQRDRFIAYFDTFESAAKFAKKHYPNIDSHVEPYPLYEFKKEEDK